MTANRSGSHTAHIKSSYLSTREYDEAHMHKRFANICEAMHARTEQELGFEPSDVTSRSLSLLIGNLRAFVESALGKDSDPETRTVTKFPHKLFMDYRPEGALYNMLCVCLNFKYLHGLRRFEFANMDKRGFNFDILVRIEKSLKDAHMLPMVKVYFAETLPAAELPNLRTVVQKRGTIVSSATAATHIIYPDPPGTTVTETVGTDYCRPLRFRENLALVHWWYHPDSYDSWIPRSDVDGEPEPAEEHDGPWHVQMRWLQDTELYNEWMNEADYEIPADDRLARIPDSRAQASSRTAKDGIAHNETKLPDNTVKSSKKRKRLSSSIILKATADVTSERETNKDKTGEMDLDNLSAGSADEDVVRKPRRRSDVSGKERKSRDSPDYGKSRKDGDVHHHRKKARLSEEGKKGTGKGIPTQSVKLRLSLKAPHERSKSRSKDRVKDERARDNTKHERREASADSRGGAGLKVRVKLTKPSNVSGSDAPRIDTRVRDSDNDDAMSTQGKIGEITSVRTSDDIHKDEREKKEKRIVKAEKDSPATMGHAASKDGDKAGADDEVQNGEAGPEQKRPFSRRKSRKKERSREMKMPGVTVVEDAVPLPEGEVPRIRNISNEGTDPAALKDRMSRDKTDMSDSMALDEARDGKTAKEKEDKPNINGGRLMDVDTNVANRRVMAVSETMLDGDVANAPVSGADIVEALPPATIRMPAHSRWFRLDAIHDIEKRSLSEFFNNRNESKTPMVYKKYRDFMIDVWRQSPEKYLTATSVRRHLAGDVCAILRVHAFLEHWGLINYGTEPESKPYLTSSLRTRYSRARPVLLDGSVKEQVNGVPRLLFFDEPHPPKREAAPVSLQKAVKSAKEKRAQQKVPSLLSRRELYATAAATKYECDGCGMDCSRMRYHCVGNADIELCPSCFANGMYPETQSARDFEQLTTVLGSEAHDGSVWSEAEVLLLLEGLEKFGDDWNQVAEHVGTKTNEQCVLQFLRMPIEDSFLGDQLGKWEMGQYGMEQVDVVQEGKCDGEHKFAGPMLPFADTANPIMAQVAFLASSVSPDVAAAAAQAALHQLMSENGPKSESERERKSAQAKVLVGAAHEHNGSAENGIPEKSMSNGSKLGTLPGTKLDSVAVEAAAAVGLAAAVAKARKLADAEVREIEREFAVAVETKLRVVDLKLQEFDRLEQHMRRERDRLEKQRQSVYADRVEAALMRTGSATQASRVAAAHQAAASVAAGIPVPHIYTGPMAGAARPAGMVPAQSIVGQASSTLMPRPAVGGGTAPTQMDGGK